MLLLPLICVFVTGLILYYYSWFSVKGAKAAESESESENKKKFRNRSDTLEVGTIGILKELYYSNFCLKNVFLRWAASSKVTNIQIFNNRFVFINDVAVAKEAFNDYNMCGRMPAGKIWGRHSNSGSSKYGIMHSDGPGWTEQNRFVRRHLKYFGMGTKSMEAKITEEVTDFIKYLSGQTGKVIYPLHLFPLPVLNSLWFMIGGEKYSQSDNEMTKLIIEAYECVKITTSFPDNMSVFWKLPQKLFPRYFSGQRIKKILNEMRHFLKNLVEQHRRASSDTRLPNDFIDAYLEKMEATDDMKSSFYGDNGDKNLVSILTDLFMAGGETTSTMLSWAMLHLVRNSHVQEKIQAELDYAIGRERPPTLADRQHCPYTEAFIMETLRLTPVGGVTLPHAVIKDGHIGNLAVSQGTIIFLNIAGIQCDPHIWDDAHAFNPERFLDSEGKCIYKHEGMVAFSVGKRRCPGEQLARDNLFLIISSICHRFHVLRDPTLSGPPPLAGSFAFLFKPNQFGILLEDRN